MSNATPRPWSRSPTSRSLIVSTKDHLDVATTYGDTPEEVEDNAELILHAVNAHDALVAALEAVVKTFERADPAIIDTVWVSEDVPETLYDHCVAALKQARGEP